MISFYFVNFQAMNCRSAVPAGLGESVSEDSDKIQLQEKIFLVHNLPDLTESLSFLNSYDGEIPDIFA